MKKLIIVFVIFSLVLNLGGCFDENNQILITNFKEKSLEDFSITKFIEETANIQFLEREENFKVEEFTMGVTDDKKVRLMVITIVEETDFEAKRYSIYYNRDNDYLKVKENKISKNKIRGRISAKYFFTKLDMLKNIMKFPEGPYKYYNIQLLVSSDNVTIENEKDKEVYIVDNGNVYELKDEETTGICVLVYGESKGMDAPIYYVIR